MSRAKFQQLRSIYRSRHKELRIHIADHYEDRDSHGKQAEEVLRADDREGQYLLRRRNEMRAKTKAAARAAGVTWP